MATNAHPMPTLDRRDTAALTEYMTVLDDVGRARHAPFLYSVTSQSGREYLVDVTTGACECDDAFYRQPDGGCKHLRRVQFATGRRDIPEWADRSRIDPDLGRHVTEENV